MIQERILTEFSLKEHMATIPTAAASGTAGGGGVEKDNLVNKVPSVLETGLKSQGALYMKANPGKEYAPQDGLLLTGHFDSSQIWYDVSSITLST